MKLSLKEIEAKLAHLGPLEIGNHAPDGKACIMEAVAYVAGEGWSDHPDCACPVIAAFLRAWNDVLPDDQRDALLRPLIPRLIDTRASSAIEKRRSLMVVDWLVREYTPTWLRLAGLYKHADTLSSLPKITAMAQIPSILPTIDAAWEAARNADWAAAGAMAWNDARTAAWAAARDAARATAGDVALTAAGDDARTAAWAAARAAAWAAANAAAKAALSQTRRELQQSALALINRMIDARDS